MARSQLAPRSDAPESGTGAGRPARSERDAQSRRWLALTVLCIPLLIVSLDNTVLNVALPTLVRKLHATTSQLQWIVDAYVLVFGGLMLTAGSLADHVGRKRTFLAGLVTFAAGSTWAALSGSVGMLIAARASMGIGAALIMPSTLSIITNTFVNRGERQRALGVWSGTSGAGIALGPIVGGLLLAHFWWGSVFLINLPIVIVGVLCAIPLVPDSKNPVAERPDPGGALLSIAGLGLVLWAIIEAPVHGWTSALVVGLGTAGLAILVAFVVQERSRPNPLLNLQFFASRHFSAAVVSNGMLMFSLFGALFMLTQFLQFELGYTALEAGVRTLPAAAAIAAVAPLSSALVRRVGTKLTVVAGLLVVAGGLWQISGATPTATYASALPGMIMLGVGSGLVLPSATGSVMGSLPSEHTGVGSGTNGTFIQVGGALGVAVIGSLLSTRYEHRMTSALAPYHVPRAVEHVILGSLGGALSVARHIGGTVGVLLTQFARPAFISGMDLGLLVGAAVALAAAVVALLALPSRPGTEKPKVVPPRHLINDVTKSQAQRRSRETELFVPMARTLGPEPHSAGDHQQGEDRDKHDGEGPGHVGHGSHGSHGHPPFCSDTTGAVPSRTPKKQAG
jgi:EmrB/QacA subfamily drug resistance transporter